MQKSAFDLHFLRNIKIIHTLLGLFKLTRVMIDDASKPILVSFFKESEATKK